MTVFIWLWHLELYNCVFISLKKLRELVECGFTGRPEGRRLDLVSSILSKIQNVSSI